MPANRSKRRRSDDVDYSSNHPSTLPPPPLPVASEKKDTDSSGLLETLQRHIDDLRSHIYCGVCIKPLYEPYTLPCGHTFCYSCLVQWFTSHGQSKTCPDCRSSVKSPPAPAYLVRNIVHMFIGRSELTDANETTHEHLANQVAETERVENDKKNTDPEKGGLFQGCFNKTKAPIRDDDEGVTRCPGCLWELEDGECMQCGYSVSDSEDADVDELDELDDDLDALEAIEEALNGTFTEDEDDFMLGGDPYGYEFNYHSDQPFMDVFGGEGSVDGDSLDEDSVDEDSIDESDEESSESSDASESSHSTVRRASNGNSSSVIEIEDEEAPSVQEILSADHTEEESDDDDEPVRPAPRRRNARPQGAHDVDFSFYTNGVRMRVRGNNGAVAEGGTDSLSALVIDDSSSPRQPVRQRNSQRRR
ncbi:RING finger domain-containing protein [Arthroderma uncinatum]|uniref:RING finger domain-containing protein n=1 Tax=Arthroderma uncinatum TaxID=74035 RepID=UPI00144AE400|nr:RING finger domain-containing protein [Arthroderma uncinatum]KAF3481655.1 RING finger domain-containing protein [Arthroderma uncinatum]